jgi:hypothetical protein
MRTPDAGVADDRFGRCDVAELRIELTAKQSSSADCANERNATAAVTAPGDCSSRMR